jgi:CBS domain containing-hemolysin-like protein
MFIVLGLLCLIPGASFAEGPGLDPLVDNRDTHLILLIAYMLLALVFSFLCSIAEAVLLSITPAYIESQKERRPRFAARLDRLKNLNVDQSLAAILTLNTIAHTVGAIGAGAQASLVFGSAWFGLFSAVMTLMILFLSEIVPKTIGAMYWSKLARPTAWFVQGLIISLYPIVWISQKLTNVISHGRAMHIFSRDELRAMARVGAETGHIQANESRIIQNLLQLEFLTIADVMTPRIVISALPENMQISDALEHVSKHPFSRLPVFENKIDDINGFVLRDDVLLKTTQQQGSLTLKSIKRDILVVPQQAGVSLLLERLLKERKHIAIVVDEYGDLTGLVTLEDLIETLIGTEIIDEIDKVPDMRAFARELWKLRAQTLGIDLERMKEKEK